MKRTYQLQDLDCANCAAKMENAINDIPEVKSATVSFMTQKLSLDTADEHLELVLDKVERIIKNVEPDAALVR